MRNRLTIRSWRYFKVYTSDAQYCPRRSTVPVWDCWSIALKLSVKTKKHALRNDDLSLSISIDILNIITHFKLQSCFGLSH